MTDLPHEGRPGRSGFPDGRQIALTWSIPETFGGLTSSMLRRSRTFREYGGVDVEVYTLDQEENRIARDAVLSARDALVPGVAVGNLYDWLRENPLPGGSLRLDREVFTPLADGDGEAVRDEPDGPLRRRVRRHADGAILQIDHYRPDGTLVLSDRRDARQRGKAGGRSLVLCDDAGEPVRSWRRVAHLYTAWLDALTGRDPAFLIVDSKVVAGIVADYRRRNVVTVHVVHGSHRDRGGPHTVRRSRRAVFQRLQDFDAVVFATRGQRRDVRVIVGRKPHLVTVPSSLPPATGGRVGPREGAAIVARLEPLKQVDQAIRAVQQANAMLPTPLVLDVYGDGPLREKLRAGAAGGPAIRFHGFRTDVRERLSETSVLLLTSRSEAFGLVIGEAMAVGCLPIAYDIAYGPADLIRDGRTGWLAPPGDVDALAAALVAAVQAPPRRVRRMRELARRRAAGYSEERIVARWASVLRGARRRRALRRWVGRLRRRLHRGDGR